jgi:hypothetical protein
LPTADRCLGARHIKEAHEEFDAARLGDRALVGRAGAGKARDGERGLGGGLLVLRAEQRHEEQCDRLLVLGVVERERCERGRRLLARLMAR